MIVNVWKHFIETQKRINKDREIKHLNRQLKIQVMLWMASLSASLFQVFIVGQIFPANAILILTSFFVALMLMVVISASFYQRVRFLQRIILARTLAIDEQYWKEQDEKRHPIN